METLASILESLSPRALGDPHKDPLIGYLVEKYERIQERAEVMFRSLEVLYREGILDEPTIRAVRRQREEDGSHLIQRYKDLLCEFKRRGDGPRPEEMARARRLADALILKADHLERSYLHEKQRLKITTELEAVRDERSHLEQVAQEYHGSGVAYRAEESLARLRSRAALLENERRRSQMELEAMHAEFSILAGEYILATREKGQRAHLAAGIREAQTRLAELRDQLGALPPRRDTRRRLRSTVFGTQEYRR